MFGTTLQRARTFFVGEATTAKRVLIVGEGNGRFLLELLRDAEGAQIDCVDSSAAMLDLARQRLARHHPDAIGRVRFIRSTLEDWPLPDCLYDLIVTHFVLDCFPPQPLEAVVAKLAHAATPAANWLLADFDYPATPARRLHARLWIAAMYLVFPHHCRNRGAVTGRPFGPPPITWFCLQAEEGILPRDGQNRSMDAAPIVRLATINRSKPCSPWLPDL